MISHLKTLLRNEYAKTLVVKNKEKNSISYIAGKAFIILLIMMLLFTFLSRAAESITVAQVVVEQIRRDILNYSFTGTGKIILAEEECLAVLPNYRIERIYVSCGERVGKDTILFRYDIKDLHNKYKAMELELEKIKLQMQKEELSREDTAEGNLKASLLTLTQAKENHKMAEKNLEEAEKDYAESLKKTKEELLEDKRKEYKVSLKDYELLLSSQGMQQRLAKRTLDDARNELVKVSERPETIKRLIEAYKAAVLSDNSVSVYYAKEAIFEAYYGSAKDYAEHKEAVQAAELAVIRASENLTQKHIEKQNELSYYNNLYQAAFDELEKAKNSLDPMLRIEENMERLWANYFHAQHNYLQRQEDYKNQIMQLDRALTDTSNELNKIRNSDIKLGDYLFIYQASAAGSEQEAAYSKLYDFLMGEDRKRIERDMDAKKLVFTRAEEDYEILRRDNEKNRIELKAQLSETENIIKSMERGTYDYEEAIEGKRQAIKSGEEAVRIAKQAVAFAEQSNYATNQQGKKSKKMLELIQKEYQIDILQKEQELSAMKKLIDTSGVITSPYEGIVSYIDLEVGKTTRGEELIKIGMGDYLFKAEVLKEEAVYANIGSKMRVSLAGKEEAIQTEVKGVSMNENGRIEVTAVLPEKEYMLGELAEFRVAAQSEVYDMCIPIQALHKENSLYYVLVTREQEDILGTELIATRVEVEVLSKDKSTVAVEGGLSSKDYIIVDSNKYVNAGDKVRLK